MNRAVPISISLAFGPHSYASTVKATVGGWPFGSAVCSTPVLFPEVLNAKQGNSVMLGSWLYFRGKKSSKNFTTPWPTYKLV